MATRQFSELTVDELKSLIRTLVDERLREVQQPLDKEAIKATNEAIRKLRWTPPAGAPSSLELMREDRDKFI